MPKRRVLLVDDEVTVLLTMKAVLEISGFDVDTATSAREGKSKIRTREYQMIITDMRMESDASGREVIQAARTAPYHPAVALLTAYPMAEDDWQDMGADRMLVKPMQTPVLIRQLEKLLDSHAAKLQKISAAAAAPGPEGSQAATGHPASDADDEPTASDGSTPAPKAKKSAAKRLATKSLAEKNPAPRKPAKKAMRKKV